MALSAGVFCRDAAQIDSSASLKTDLSNAHMGFSCGISYTHTQCVMAVCTVFQKMFSVVMFGNTVEYGCFPVY